MKKNELSRILIPDTKNKKHYTSPKIEFISDIRDLTKGGGLGVSDGATQQNGFPPSQPAGT
jgi:hypothetical protein